MIAEFCWALFLEFGLCLDQLHTAGARSISHLPTRLSELKPMHPQCIWCEHTHTLSYSSDTSVAPDLKLSQVGGGVSVHQTC